MDTSPAVFKTVCGALLRRPGWVRFPSIPAIFQPLGARNYGAPCAASEMYRIDTSVIDGDAAGFV
jgi:hypothetical protein